MVDGTWGSAAAPRDVLGPVAGEPAFDAHHPPRRDLVDDCVHCGFCLTTCPTYVLWGEEMDSPRGRIYLMKQGLDGEPMSDALVRHMDACLGCMACVTACPSGVRYDRLIEDTRAQVERRHERPAGQRLLREAIFALFPYPRRLRLVRGPLRAYQASGLQRLVARSGLLPRLAPTLATLESLAPRLRRVPRPPRRVPARGARRAVVGVLTGCVQSAFFPDVNAATIRVLAAEGCDVVVPPQGCCGALSVHNGREAEAQGFARRLIDRFAAAGVEHVVVNAAGCGSTMKHYARMFHADPAWQARAAAIASKVKDVSELCAELEPRAPRHPLSLRVAYHDACHLSHGQGIRKQPRAVLAAIPGIQLVDVPEPEQCCGSAGVYNLLEPASARAIGRRKADNIQSLNADVLVSANPGCTLQIVSQFAASGARIRTAHPIEVVDASIRGVDLRGGGGS